MVFGVVRPCPFFHSKWLCFSLPDLGGKQVRLRNRGIPSLFGFLLALATRDGADTGATLLGFHSGGRR